MSVMTRSTAPPSAASSTRLTMTLALGGAVAGLLIVLGYILATPAIEANRAATTDAAIHDVLSGVARYDELALHDGVLAPGTVKAAGAHGAEKVYAGYSADGAFLGFAITAKEPGFQEPIEILYGYDPRRDLVLGLAILSSRETPGLGDKIQHKSWRSQFAGKVMPLLGVRAGASAKPGDVDMITGATISSRAVIGAVNRSVEKWKPVLGTFKAGGGS